MEVDTKVDLDLDYLRDFENKVIIRGYQEGMIPAESVWIPSRIGSLARTKFGRAIKTRFIFPGSLVIEYYGLKKKSLHFMSEAVDCAGSVGMIVDMVKFSNITEKHIKTLAPSMLSEFPDFKAALIKLRYESNGSKRVLLKEF